MAGDVPFISGKPGYLSLKTGTTQMDIPCIAGTGYTVGDNDVIESLAQAGAFGAAPGNILAGMSTPVLDVVCRGFSGWLSASNLAAMFGATPASAGVPVNLALRANANGDIPFLDMKFSNGVDTATDTVKLARFSVEGSGATNDLLFRLTFLGMGVASVATWTAFSASAGTPYYWKHVAPQWRPSGSTYASLYGMQSFSMAAATGLSYGKWADGTDTPSSLDPLADLAGGATLVQRSGAGARAIANRFGTLLVGINYAGAGGIQFEMGLNRQGVVRTLNPAGGIMDRSQWQMYRSPTVGTILSVTESAAA